MSEVTAQAPDFDLGVRRGWLCSRWECLSVLGFVFVWCLKSHELAVGQVNSREEHEAYENLKMVTSFHIALSYSVSVSNALHTYLD